MLRIERIEPEASEHATVWLKREMPCEPGRFVMVWIPRLDEKPFTISCHRPDRIGITVRRRGRFTSRLLEMSPGDVVGIRGPYGRGFDLKPNACMVAGGCGLATVAPIKDLFPDMPMIHGAQTEPLLLFRKRFPDMTLCTDDGSAGYHGFPTDLLEELLDQQPLDVVYTCGPEVMMRRVFDICEERGVRCQASLERYMKCGFGVCGQCACGDRLVCRDGPVFDSDALRTMDDFGRSARLKDGRKVTLKEYAAWRE